MKIVLVIDYFGNTTNGTTMTARHLYKQLEKAGHEVAVITGEGNGWKNVYETGIVKLPFVQFIFKNNGFFFGKYNKKIVEEALKGADLVHFLADFHLERKVKKYCDKHHIRTFAAFHIQPENATYQLGLRHFKFINSIIYNVYRLVFFDKFEHIHCPSQMIANELTKHHYKAKLHIISNGISDRFHRIEVEKPNEYKDKFVISMVGRITNEKRQDLVVKAIAKSKYKDRIQLFLLGRGMWTKKINKLAKRLLKSNYYIGFVEHDELLKILNYTDLYIHASDIEIEAISCMEAFACGNVPIISDSPQSATGQFALSNNNLFKAGNYRDLAKKIDYWFEHEDERKEYEEKYINYSQQFLLQEKGAALVELFEDYVNGKNI